VSAQGLTYPHDFVLSRTLPLLLRRIITKTAIAAKLLILLEACPCRERGQGGAKRDRLSLSGRVGLVTHKVFHRRGGELQNAQQIMNLRAECKQRLKIIQNAPSAAHGRR
jgi:hypothetical protein